MLDTHRYQDKPQGVEVGKIQNRLAKSQIGISDLADALKNGYSFKPALLNGKGESDWISQQIFAIDFDDGTTIEKELSRCEEIRIMPVFGYTSFSNTIDHNRFRLVFCTEQPTGDYNQAKALQLDLIKAFPTCDQHCSNLSRLFFGGKNLIYQGYDNRINADKIIQRYGTENIVKPISKTKERNSLNDNIEAIKNLDVKKMQELLFNGGASRGVTIRDDIYIYSNSHPPTQMSSRAELYRFFDNINLTRFLGIEHSGSFRCLFHNDKNPSASIFRHRDTGGYIYHCNAASCGWTGGILRCIQQITHCGLPKAINFLKDVYNLSLEDSEYQKKARQFLRTNIDYITSAKFKIEHPDVYKIICKKNSYSYIPLLVLLNEQADQYLNDKPILEEDKAVFCKSLNSLLRLMGMKKKDKLAQRINLFVYFGLLGKVDYKDLPDNIVKSSKHIAALKGNKYLTNYYSISSYDNDLLNQSDKAAQVYKNKKCTMPCMTKEGIRRTFDKETYNRIFPQFKDEENTDFSNEFEIKCAEIINQLIERYGYAKENEILEYLDGNPVNNKRRLKRCLPEILETYSLRIVRAKKELKHKYHIIGKGASNIIIKA